jgi:hypothetical protein
MADRIGGAAQWVAAALTYLAGLPPTTQIVAAASTAVAAILLVVYREYRRHTRTTPTLRARATQLLDAGWKAARAPLTDDQKATRANAAENLLVFFFVFVVAGLIMQGLIPFARDDMGLTGPWPHLLFFALDGMAAYFGLVAYRLAKDGINAPGPRLMVLTIMAGSSWFQWAHAADRDLPARVAWAALPLIAGYLWETVLRYRRRAWKKSQPDTGRQVPRARWIWDPIGSLGITRRTHMWNLPTWETGLETHMTRAECVRQLRREFGLFWAYRVPADVAIRLKRGFKVEEAAARVPQVIEQHRREVENRRLVKEAERVAKAGTLPNGTYTISMTPDPGLGLLTEPGGLGVVEASEPTPDAPVWVDPADAWEPAPTNDQDAHTDPWAAHVDDEDQSTEPWDEDPFADLPAPTPGERTSVVTPEPAPLLTTWKTPVLPTDDRGRQIAPRHGEPAFQAAVDLYLDCEKHGIPLSGRKLCEKNGVNPDNRLWRQAVVREAKAQQAAAGQVTPVLF